MAIECEQTIGLGRASNDAKSIIHFDDWNVLSSLSFFLSFFSYSKWQSNKLRPFAFHLYRCEHPASVHKRSTISLYHIAGNRIAQIINWIFFIKINSNFGSHRLQFDLPRTLLLTCVSNLREETGEGRETEIVGRGSWTRDARLRQYFSLSFKQGKI